MIRMARDPKRPRRSADDDGSPLDNKQRALRAAEEKLRAEMERVKKFVEDAPKLAEDRRRQQRKELVRRAAEVHRNDSPRRLADPRFLEANIATPARGKALRSERRQGRLMFFVLLLALAGAVFYFYYTITHS